jgi:CTP synthase
MQVAVIDFARDVLGYKDANSIEFNPATRYPVVELPPEKMDRAGFEIEMRRGLQPCKNKPGSRIHGIYGNEGLIYERHRHKYEINGIFVDDLEKCGFAVTGRSPDGRFIEVMEIADHPWFLCVMFQPEFKSRPTRPHPVFIDFVKAALDNRSVR